MDATKSTLYRSRTDYCFVCNAVFVLSLLTGLKFCGFPEVCKYCVLPGHSTLRMPALIREANSICALLFLIYPAGFIHYPQFVCWCCHIKLPDSVTRGGLFVVCAAE